MLPTACARRHEIAALPHCSCMPPLPSAIWGDGRRHHRLRRQRQQRGELPEGVAARATLDASGVAQEGATHESFFLLREDP
jgi:hypothetical protein